MTQNEIANATGFAQSYIHYVLKGDRVPSVDNAIKLEKVTGICREGWVFPERHWNPYIPFSSYANCGNCKNKIHRTTKVVELMLDHFKSTKNKRKAIKKILEISKTIHGYKNSECISIREITDKGLKLLSYIGSPKLLLPGLLPSSKFAHLIDELKENNHLFLSTLDILNPKKEDKPIRRLNNKVNIKSVHRFSSKRHLVLIAVNTEREQRFNDASVAILVELITVLDQIWHDSFYA